jgi:hypothetical protein
MTSREVMQQALEALDSDHSDIQLRAALALREALAQEHAMHELARLGQEIEQEPSQWRDMVVVTLVREGVNKHRARELADHFAAQPVQQAEPECEHCHGIGKTLVYGIEKSWEENCLYCNGTGITPAAQRPWQGLTDDDWKKVANRKNTVLDTFEQGATWAAYKLEKRNDD